VTRIRIVFAEALRSIGANVSTTVASAVSVLIGLFLIGVFIGLATWLVSWSNDKKSELAVHVFFCAPPSQIDRNPRCPTEATPKQINAVRVRLESDPRVKDNGITFVSKADALAKMRKREPELTRYVLANPLPASYDVVPKHGEDTEAVALTLRGGKLAGVDKVEYGEEVSKRVLGVARAIQIVAVIAVLILLGASTILIGNTIRLSIFSRRREIEVMKLVGASNWYVRGPFMLEGMLTGLVGAIAAVVLLFIAREAAVPRILGHLQENPDVRALAFTWTALILVTGGLAIGALGSGLTLHRFLRV
jgi:cell division transport system permease protein